jgi:hypothetical protein
LLSKVLPPRLISTASRYAALWDAGAVNGSPFDTPFTSGVISTVANTAIFIPFHLPFPYPVKRLFWVNGTAVSGNVDIGLYSGEGKRLYSAGSTAQAGTSATQFVTPSPAFILPSDVYYMGFVADNTTGQCFRRSNLTGLSAGLSGGMLQQASAFPLPADLSSAIVHTSAVTYILAGITLTGSGF